MQLEIFLISNIRFGYILLIRKIHLLQNLIMKKERG